MSAVGEKRKSNVEAEQPSKRTKSNNGFRGENTKSHQGSGSGAQNNKEGFLNGMCPARTKCRRT